MEKKVGGRSSGTELIPGKLWGEEGGGDRRLRGGGDQSDRGTVNGNE